MVYAYAFGPNAVKAKLKMPPNATENAPPRERHLRDLRDSPRHLAIKNVDFNSLATILRINELGQIKLHF